jgi:hypothetical protein
MTDTTDAYIEAKEARMKLERAAERLGYEGVFELADAARDGELPDDVDEDGVRAITNAHSYLNNGMLENL